MYNSTIIELTDEELIDIDGGVNWLKVAGGGLIIARSIVSGGALGVVAIGVASGAVTIIDGI